MSEESVELINVNTEIFDDDFLPRLQFDNDLIAPISEGMDPLSLLFPSAITQKYMVYMRFIQIFWTTISTPLYLT